MEHLKTFIFVSLLAIIESREICYEDYGCFQSSYNLFHEKPIVILPESPSKVNTTFTLYNKHTSGETIATDRVKDFINANPTKLIIHGLFNSALNQWVIDMKDAILRNENVNVITVNWSDGNKNLYAVPNTQIVGVEMGKLMKHLIQANGMKGQDFHLIGHSLGAHASGYAGHWLKENTDQVLGRITGLDPAGPYFENANPYYRLDPNDAQFVDAIHTDSSHTFLFGFGIYQPVGHVDFYPNGGETQPDCPTRTGKLTSGFFSILFDGLEYAKEQVSCNHRASFRFFTDSIENPCQYTAFPCNSIDEFSSGNCIKCPSQGCNSMGYWASKSKAIGSLYMSTNSMKASSYCQQHYQLSLISDENEDDMAKGDFVIYFQINGETYQEIFDYSETILVSHSHMTKKLSLNRPFDINELASVYISYHPMSSMFDDWSFSHLWRFKHVELFSGEKQVGKKFCPVNSFVHSTLTEFKMC